MFELYSFIHHRLLTTVTLTQHYGIHNSYHSGYITQSLWNLLEHPSLATSSTFKLVQQQMSDRPPYSPTS